jgi:hypothetical protein
VGHFIAYHNTEKMGYALHEREPLRLLTNKRVHDLVCGTIWMITGEGSKDRRYALASVFDVNEVGGDPDTGFKYYAKGEGHVFRPPVPLNDQGWFAELLKSTGNFSPVVQEVTDRRMIQALKRCASAAGAAVD